MTPGRAALLVLAVAVLAVPALAATSAGAASTPRGTYAAACRRAADGPTLAAVPVSTRSALPPLPLPIVLRATRTAVVARVVAVLYQGPRPRWCTTAPGFAGPIPPSRCQVVRLRVAQTLLGTPPTPLVVLKPLAPYQLQVSRGVQAGTFLLDDSTPYPEVLGTYGPSTYAPSAVRAALAAGLPGST